MSGRHSLAGLAGRWGGRSRLCLRPDDPGAESGSEMEVSLVAKGKFVRVDYTWAEGGKPQEGSILFGYDGARGAATAAWVDSWHMGEKMMICAGEVRGEGVVAVTGAYEAPPGPDWGWRLELGGRGEEAVLRMFNITPGGEEMMGVEGVYRRGEGD